MVTFFPTTTVLTAASTFVVTTTTSTSSQAVTTGGPLTTSAHDSVTSQAVTPRSVTNPPIVGVEIPRSPIDDPRVGWIHELKKARLIDEVMRLNNLNTERKSTELRKRFCEYWKDWADTGRMLAEGDPLFDETLASPQGAFGGQNMAETHQESMSKLALQLGHIKEILGLSPKADVRSLTRTLVEVVQHSRVVSDEHQDVRQPSGLSSNPETKLSYSLDYRHPISHAGLTDPPTRTVSFNPRTSRVVV